MTHRFSRFLRLALLALLVAVAPVPAFAAEGPGTVAVKQVNDSLTTLLKRKAKPGSPEEKQLAADINARVGKFLDIDALGRRALADHWDKLSEPQRAEYLKLLRKLVEASYLRALRSNLEYQVHYLDETAKNENHVVATEVRTKRNGRTETVAIDYLVHQDGADWRAIDVVTDGVGMVENYRGQFNKIIGEKGFDALLDRMRKKAAQPDSSGAP